MENDKKWFAVYTKPRWEKKVGRVLEQKGIECWCPLRKVEKQWSDRKKVIEEPLFTSYVFVNINEKEKTPVLMTDGILNFVYYVGKPAVIRDEEIDIIKKYLSEKDASVSVQSLNSLDENTRIKVNHGVFMDTTGTVLKGGKKKVFVKLESLDQVMIVEFPIEYLSPLF
ncbi:UpxY family transcription antiterminator [Segetibacter sp.]|jgi:transcription antitermination factor NusG|uniref:UpxY family transcription antiterminator n=1 Tax=Segetibacter sp. TaxID=2231182 RepID=UPI002621024B|nr:UpxY family transcription antiterminator [Segetibacter sp.]MCW3078873.1 transcriptional activator RfaH [Segetibacter sp.]